MLDRLSKVPGKPGDLDGAYQAEDSRNSQVFVFTSFGAHWHILVGYRRPRLAREHVGMSGMSKTVYDFQRIWSGRVSTERRAWELLSLIDQIHLWGVTVFRDFVIRHLKPWHEFGKRCYVNDIDFTTSSSDKRIRIFDESMVDHKEILRSKYSFDDIPSLAGKVALVTGANTPDGVGYHIAHQIALKGAKVYVGARNLQKATKAIRIMLAESPQLKPESLVPFAVDMGNFKQVQFAARKVVAEEPRLDILVNNAAVLARPLDKDANGISVSFGINYLGPFLLTRELLPLLNKTQAEHPGVRIVNVASTAHYDVPTGAKFGSLEDFNTTYGSEDEPSANYLRYGYSKLASILHTKELQRRFDQEGVDILALSVHPGGVATNGAAGYLGGRDNDIFRSNLSPFEGAITPFFAAAHPEPAQQRDKYAGSFIMPFGGLKEPTEDANNAELGKQLWTTSEKVVSSVLDCFIWDSILMPMGGIFNIGQKA
ncbi:hypothetical protein ACKLNR_009473 [Fusarium oxysporum f. sp. zingiberi]